MKYVFALDRASFSTHPALYKKLVNILTTSSVAASEKEYNALIHSLIAALNGERIAISSSLFANEVKQLNVASPLIEQTPWGGVSIKKVDVVKDFIQKLLIIRKFGILGFEIHKKKLEKLHVLEGICLLISSQHTKKGWKKGDVTIHLGTPGKKITLRPEDEHGVIALTNCVIEETSTNNLDDLVYIFPNKQQQL